MAGAIVPVQAAAIPEQLPPVPGGAGAPPAAPMPPPQGAPAPEATPIFQAPAPAPYQAATGIDYPIALDIDAQLPSRPI